MFWFLLQVLRWNDPQPVAERHSKSDLDINKTKLQWQESCGLCLWGDQVKIIIKAHVHYSHHTLFLTLLRNTCHTADDFH